MLVGNLGYIPFIVSRSLILTPQEMARESSGRWSKHDLMGQLPVLEFLGPDISKISLKIMLRKQYGVPVAAVLKELRRVRDKGLAVPLIIDGSPVTQHKWVIETIQEGVIVWGKDGSQLSVEVNLNLNQYSDGGTSSWKLPF